jgi:hypothetical protein
MTLSAVLTGCIIIVIIITCVSCPTCRQGASAACLQSKGCHKPYPLLDSPNPSKAQSTVGTVLSIVSPPASRGHLYDMFNSMQVAIAIQYLQYTWQSMQFSSGCLAYFVSAGEVE